MCTLAQCLICRRSSGDSISDKDANRNQPELWNSRPLKIVLVGDPGSGKTKLVKQFMHKTFECDEEKGLVDLHRSVVTQAEKEIPIIIYDPPAGIDGNNVHRNMYSNTDVFIVCFDVCNKRTLASIKERWIAELKSANCANDFQYLLVGTKTDEREWHNTRDNRRGIEGNTVSYEAGLHMSKDIKSEAYLECSAKTGEGVKNVFEVASFMASSRCKLNNSWFVTYRKWRSSF